MRYNRKYCRDYSSIFQKAFKSSNGQVMALFALVLPVLMGVAILGVDVGHLFVSRNIMQNAADAGAKGGTIVLAQTGNQNAAVTEARRLANLNLASYPSTIPAATNVTFPTATSIRVTVTQNVPLFFAGVIGRNTGLVNATATAQFGTITSVPPRRLVPLGIVCNIPASNPVEDNCYGTPLQPFTTFSVRRYCGNYFMSGPEGNSCGNSIQDGETFLQGITFDNNMSTDEFRDAVYAGYDRDIHWGDTAMALPANRNGWSMGMTDRLNEGHSEMIFPVLRSTSNPNHEFNIRIHGFVGVTVTGFRKEGNTDIVEFTITRLFLSDQEFQSANSPEGYAESESVVGVRLSN